MATKDQLKEKIKRLDANVETADLDHAELTALLAKLEDEQELAIQAQAKAKLEAEDKKQEGEPAPAAKPPYFMLQGKALTTKKGIKCNGDEIKPEWVNGGKDTLELFVKKGFIGKAA